MPPLLPPSYDGSFGHVLLVVFLAPLAMLCGRAMLIGIGFLAYYFILPHRDLIIQYGRKAQDLLHLPEWMRVVSRVDPGMTDREIVFGAKFLIITGLIVSLLLVCLIEQGRVWHRATIFIIGVFPALFLIMAWSSLVGMKQDRVGHDVPIPMERRRRWMSQAQLDSERADQLTAAANAEAELWKEIWCHHF